MYVASVEARFDLVRDAMIACPGPWVLVNPLGNQDNYEIAMAEGMDDIEPYVVGLALGRLGRRIPIAPSYIGDGIYKAWPLEQGVCAQCEGPCPVDFYLCLACKS